MTKHIDLSRDYSLDSLDETALDPNPICQFERWLEQAIEAQLPDPNAMTLATVGLDNRPSARIVLLKGITQDGFIFFTDYRSRKAQELEQNPQASLIFYWAKLERQVRIEGIVKKTSEVDSDLYFESRPLASRIGAWASEQSAVLQERAFLNERYDQYAAQFGEHPPRPAHWGGFKLTPVCCEFWQGRPSRLHDRFQYLRDIDNSWRITGLFP